MELLERAPVELKNAFLRVLGSLGVPEGMLAILSAVLIIGTVIGVFLGLFALMSVMERKILARVQNRYGPNRAGPFGLFQPVADGIKMLTKEDLVPRAADKVVHFLAPVVMMVPALLVLAILPYGRDMVPVELESGILFFFAVGAGTEVAIFMAGWASNNKYSVLGAMRAIAQMISYEIPLVISAVTAAMIAGSLSPSVIVAAQGGFAAGFLPHWFVTTPWGFTAALLFYIGALAESNRSPFDLPEGESELVAGHLTEYSGFKYATFFMAEYIGMFAICGMFVTLFLGGWQAPLPFLTVVPSWIWFFGKVCFVAFTMVWVRATLPRLRVDHLLAFAWKFLLPMSFAAFLSAACWHYAGRGPAAWFLSLVVVGIPYLVLGLSFTSRFSVSRRTYLFSE
ncbi:MAG: NADH-quinone oxidoreductase subunit NuoH [Chthoniobacterales bacterium]|nr:NADH-quinone oxidoreductase subunit NuoH [Chthoniobacterales bacterium]